MAVARSFSVDVLDAAGKTADDEKRCFVTADVKKACEFAATKTGRRIPPLNFASST
jgi:hypothetical protein